MGIVKFALRSPYTFLSLAAALLVVGGLTMWRMPKDVFPEIETPVVSVIWGYPGLPAAEMQDRIGSTAERAYTAYVSDIEHTETQSVAGICLIKVFFHPHAHVDAAVSQLSATSQFILRVLPPGLSPPVIVRYNASSVPVLQLAVSGNRYSAEQLYDFGFSFIRPQLATQKGATVLVPLGGKSPQISVDLDPQALTARGLSPAAVFSAVNAQNLILPIGSLRVQDKEYPVALNSNATLVSELNEIPLRSRDGTTIQLRDVAYVHEGSAVQTNLVRVDGQKSTLIPVLKGSGASTLDIVSDARNALPRIAATLPQDLNIKVLFDQSVFVRAAIRSVTFEAVLAGVLTALAILLLLGSWRSMLIIVCAIPLSAITAISILSALGYTLNVMTLGGLSLAIGMLVDDTTVEIENIHRNLQQGKSVIGAILEGAQEIANPTLASTLVICLAFVPVIFLTGAARFLFTPLALAVVFAMLASYLVSRTVVPTLARYLLGAEQVRGARSGAVRQLHQHADRFFASLRAGYLRALEFGLRNRAATLLTILALTTLALLIDSTVGVDFFPEVDAGQIRLHVRAPAGTRLEDTEALFAGVDTVIKEVIPPQELNTIVDNFGLPALPISLAYSDTPTISSADGEILVSLNPGNRRKRTSEYVQQLRNQLGEQFPGATFFFQPGDMANRILNFGLPAPIDVQVVGRDEEGNARIAQSIAAQLRNIEGLADVYVHQVRSAPALRLEVDRSKASTLGITEQDVADNVLTSLASSGIVHPNYWFNSKNGVPYLLAVQVPLHKMNSVDELLNVAAQSSLTGKSHLLSTLARPHAAVAPVNVSHYGVLPVIDVYANAPHKDLGGASRQIKRIIAATEKALPRGATLALRGQAATMLESFERLSYGFSLSVIMIYLLLAITFQSLRDPLIVLFALPATVGGAILALMVTGTTLSVPGLLGTLMSLGVGAANSILFVTFARQRLRAGDAPPDAVRQAGSVRLRPILMTALAMILGITPMAIGIGEGSEQNAPLARAVIGGLLGATLNTLFFLPLVFTWLHRKSSPRAVEPGLELLQ